MKSVRLRLLVLALLPLMVLMPILLGVTMNRWANRFDGLLISKVASDLRIAEQYMQRIVTTQGNQIFALANSTGFQLAAQSGGLRAFLARQRDELGLDYLEIRVGQGAALPPERAVVNRALNGDTATSIELFSGQDLAKISTDLAGRARVPLIVTEAAIPTERNAETRGMVVLAATRAGAIGPNAVLVGGTLLNRNLGFIDTINDLVYPGDSGQTGTATLFLEDVRISTNVRLFENVRALGTRVSEVVYHTVLDGGQTWLDRAFVVNDWYISGYLPILDSQDRRIGMLYVGFLEAPFATLKTNIYLALITAFVVIIAVSVPFFLWLASGMFSPLEQMSHTMKRVESGQLDARITDIRAKDEIGEVARHLNALLNQVQERDQKLRHWADTLNERVDRRTQALRVANDKLEETYRQLVVSEKLAVIGEITAGVAHEINNPVAVIQGNMDVLRMGLGVDAAAHDTELGLIDAQVQRITGIIGKLLQFARPDDFANSTQTVDVAMVLKDSLVLVHYPLMRANIVVEQAVTPTPKVRMDPGELQQVLVNLLMNAIHAMPDGGTLKIGVSAAVRDGQKGAEITVKDSGVGIPADRTEQIFDPFYTSKARQGTGLGLSISQTLIQKTGGRITVQSTQGQGALFIIWIPEPRELSEPSEAAGA